MPSCVSGAIVCPDERPFVRPLVSPDDCRSLLLANVDSSGVCNPNEKRTKQSVRSRQRWQVIFYLIIIMMIIMIKIILHDGADDYNHMAMQGDLQLGMHEGGY